MNYVQQNLQENLAAAVSAVLIDPETRAFAPLAGEQAAVAIAAAEEIIAASGVSARQAAQADFDIDCWDGAGFPEPGPSGETFKIAEVWEEAHDAARQALSRRWPAKIQQWQWVALALDDGKRAA